MNVLILGDGDSIWVKSVVEQTFIMYGDNVTILTRTNVEKYLDFYNNNSVRIIPYNINEFYKIVSTQKYEIFCVHFILDWFLLTLPLARMFCKKIVLVFWGSDILRLEKSNRKSRMIRWVAFWLVDRICIGTTEMLDKFYDFYGHVFDRKIRRIGFGVNGFEAQKHVTLAPAEIRNKYSIDPDKIVVSIGYNKMVAQQHLKVMEVINSLPQETRKRIHLMLKLTYGNGDNDYISKIRHYVNESGCMYSIFEEYMTDEEVAETTIITDIFIHAQTTDAKSASMQEHLYAQCLVINPSWIRYHELENRVFYLTFNNFEDLKDIIENNLVTKEKSRYWNQLVGNRQKISDIGSWESYIPIWRDIYEN